MTQTVTTASGHIQRFENFTSAFVQPRNIDVWLPDHYDTSRQFAVLYMHDGQMLFDSSGNWIHQEWGVDESLGSMMASGKIRDCIVVGIWNAGPMRHAEYLPQKPFESLSPKGKTVFREAIAQAHRQAEPIFEAKSDLYLKFLVTELKPFIDTHFSTFRNRKSTFIAGSSMGGLISLYAICEYPTVFGGAACLSTHWPGIYRNDNNPFPEAMLAYLDQHLPSPKTNRIYFDYGSATLDSLYKPTQVKVDALMRKKGFGINWITREFPGENHSEKAWKARFSIPADFLLNKLNSQSSYDGNPIQWDGNAYWGNIKCVETQSFLAADTAHLNPLNNRKHITSFNEQWQVESVKSIGGNGDTTSLPTPLYNESGMPALSIWRKNDGSLNSFTVWEFRAGSLMKATDFSSYGTISNVTDYEYAGDTTLAVKHYFNSAKNALDFNHWEKTVTIAPNGNPISSVTKQKDGIYSAFFTQYTRFDTYGNWVECKTVGELLSERIELVTIRKITYFQ